MDFKELFEKYQALLIENKSLREEIKSLRAQYDIGKSQGNGDDISEHKPEPEISEQNHSAQISNSSVNNESDSSEKIKLFMLLFRGRDDVYAKRWENPKKGTSGYAPVCANEWKPGICQKSKTKCADCKYKDYLVIDEKVIDAHLRGKDLRSNDFQGQDKFVAGIYPMCLDETCYFLAIDFDDEGWQNDVITLRKVCSEFKIPISVERSRSGKGAHVWFFFEGPIAASLARKLGSAMLTYAMSKRHEIKFKGKREEERKIEALLDKWELEKIRWAELLISL